MTRACTQNEVLKTSNVTKGEIFFLGLKVAYSIMVLEALHLQLLPISF